MGGTPKIFMTSLIRVWSTSSRLLGFIPVHCLHSNLHQNLAPYTNLRSNNRLLHVRMRAKVVLNTIDHRRRPFETPFIFLPHILILVHSFSRGLLACSKRCVEKNIYSLRGYPKLTIMMGHVNNTAIHYFAGRPLVILTQHLVAKYHKRHYAQRKRLWLLN